MSKHQMNSVDAAWLHMDRPTNLMVVNSVLWFDEAMDLKRVRVIIRERLVKRFPRFRQRIVEPRFGVGAPRWEDDPHFDLARHVHHIALPEPGDRAALQELVGDLISTPLDRSKPLWDIYVVDGYGCGMALVTRMHHSIADGIALARVLLSMTDAQPQAGIAPMRVDGGCRCLDGVTKRLTTGAHLARAAMHEGIELVTYPRAKLRDLLRQSAADTRALGKLLLTPPDQKTALRGELGVAQKAVWTDQVTLAEVKSIGRSTGTTVNDVLVTALTGALHRYLVGRRSRVEELRAMIPFNLRPPDKPLPRELGNRFGLAYLPLPVGLRDRRQRLREVHRRMEAIKHSPEGALAYGLLGLIGLTPPHVEQRLVDVFSSKCTLVLTNIPGPGEPVYFAGARVAGVVGWVPSGGSISTGISIVSYNGTVSVGVRVDARLVPDPETLIDLFQEELSQLGRVASP